MKPPLSLLEPVLHRLLAAGLVHDATQVLDALWLARWMPAPRVDDPSSEAATGVTHAVDPPAVDAAVAPGRAAPADPSTAGTTTVTLAGAAAAPAPAEAGLYAPGARAEAAHDDALRARAVRVAGVPALPDAAAMARALRPLGKRRPSRTRQELDETATVDGYAETGMLVPRFAALRERSFAATLLVEDSPALPLWRTLAAELEDLLARQGGFRSLRRYTLALNDGAPMLRSRSGAWIDPDVLREDDRTLVLLATDGTSAAWADGRMAALLQALGEHSSLALLQWLPEARWPHTALGSAELTARLPRAGAPNNALTIARPTWLDRQARIVAAPLCALTAAAMGRLAAALMAKPGQHIGAAMLWPAGTEGVADEEANDDPAPASAAERVARFRSVAAAPLLQAAVHLSAAAPLTLPVVRLVHRVMRPDAAADELPMLLLGGLLERRSAATPGRDDEADDDAIEFEFADGVRELLQRSLTRSDALEVRRAVSRHISERSGSAVDFRALVLDPQGTLTLPHWARPFAEVTRQVQQLFAPRQPPAPPQHSVQERQWSPGVTVQCEIELPGQIKQLRWSRSGQRLAVLHEYGVDVLQLKELGPGRRAWQLEPLPLARPVPVLFVKGFDIDEAAAEAFIQRVREQWPTAFAGGLELQYHTVAAAHWRNPGRSLRSDVERLTKLLRKPRPLVCCIGGRDFFDSGWLREAHERWQGLFEGIDAGRLLAVIGDNPKGLGIGRWRVHRLTPPQPLGEVQGPAWEGGALLLTILRGLGPRLLREAVFDANACAIAWNAEDRLLVADSRRSSVVREGDQRVVADFSPHFAKGEAVYMDAHPSRPVLALAAQGALLVANPQDKPQFTTLFEDRVPIEHLAWAGDGSSIALRTRDGRASRWLGSTVPAALMPMTIAAGPTWFGRSPDRAYVTAEGTVHLGDDAGRRTLPLACPDAGTIDASDDGRWLAVGRADARITLATDLRSSACRVLQTRVPGGDFKAAPLLAFVPRMLDSGFEALVAAMPDERRVTLLRISAAAASLVVPMPDTPGPWATPEQVTRAACDVLHALALAFHVGRLLPAPASASYWSLLEIEPESSDGRALAHVVGAAEWLFGDTVPRVLAGGTDPLAEPDVARGRDRWLADCKSLHEAANRLRQAGPHRAGSGITPSAHAELLDALSRLSAVHVQLLASEQEKVAQAIGEPFGDRVDEWLRLAPDEWSPAAAESVAACAQALAQDSVVELVADEAARASWLGPGYEAFGAARLDTYLEAFIERWHGWVRRLGLSGDGDDLLEIGYAAPIDALQRVQRLFDDLQIDISPEPAEVRDGIARHFWRLPRRAWAPMVQCLGAIVCTQLAARLGGRVPMAWAVPGLTLLWVDDKPANNRSEAAALRRRGLRVLTALDTASALQLLQSEHVDAIVSDMGRPGDRRAGLTLLSALRERGLRCPFLLYTAPTVLEELAHQPLPDIAVVTDQFDELEATLRRLLTTAPPAR